MKKNKKKNIFSGVFRWVFRVFLVGFLLPTLSRLEVPTRRVVSGAELPIHILGQDALHLNPYAYASALPLLSATWSLAGTEESLLEGSWTRGVGVALQPTTSGGVAVLRAGSPGTALVSVRVRIMKSVGTRGQYQVTQLHITFPYTVQCSESASGSGTNKIDEKVNK